MSSYHYLTQGSSFELHQRDANVDLDSGVLAGDLECADGCDFHNDVAHCEFHGNAVHGVAAVGSVGVNDVDGGDDVVCLTDRPVGDYDDAELCESASVLEIWTALDYHKDKAEAALN